MEWQGTERNGVKHGGVECNGMDARNPDGGGSNGEALATIKSDGLMVTWGIANDRRINRGVQVELAGGIQNAAPPERHLHEADIPTAHSQPHLPQPVGQ